MIRLNLKKEITGQASNNGAKEEEIMAPLKHLRNFCRGLTDCEINLMLSYSANCIISSNVVTNQTTAIKITETNLYVTVMTWATHSNTT